MVIYAMNWRLIVRRQPPAILKGWFGKQHMIDRVSKVELALSHLSAIPCMELQSRKFSIIISFRWNLRKVKRFLF
ncbi:hypothetical protein F320042A7_40860 [Blautia producta]